tara:strand:+ start:270 stop:449 length:180 start_codon:yes stop_codon:yes gene_type:complete
MKITEEQRNIERAQTRIEMIRSESRQISYRIDALQERRKQLQQDKKDLKNLISIITEQE